MDKFDELLAKADAIANDLKFNEIALQDSLARAMELQVELLITEIEEQINDGTPN